MSRICENCGKKTVFGNQIARRGMAKYLGGVGVKTTGVSRRTFKPNLQKVRILDAGGAVRAAKICTKCIRSGVVKRPLKRDIPEGLRVRIQAEKEAKGPEARRRAAAERGARRRQRRAAMKKPVAAKAGAPAATAAKPTGGKPAGGKPTGGKK